MAKTPDIKPKPKPQPPSTGEKDKPPRDTREKPAQNPEGPGEQTATHTREEVEKIRPNQKR